MFIIDRKWHLRFSPARKNLQPGKTTMTQPAAQWKPCLRLFDLSCAGEDMICAFAQPHFPDPAHAKPFHEAQRQ
jgi:hypothetical protein